MRIIIGLGNPGKEYERTRHSVGFSVADYLAKEYKASFELIRNLESEIADIKISGEKIILAKPQTFMNNSGRAVRKLVKSLKFKVSNLGGVHDDIDVPFGKIKVSFDRGTAGHKGAESVVRALKTNKFYRVRFGTSNNQLIKIRKMKDKRKRLAEMNKFVVGGFTPNEKSKLNKLIKTAAGKILQV